MLLPIPANVTATANAARQHTATAKQFRDQELGAALDAATHTRNEAAAARSKLNEHLGAQRQAMHHYRAAVADIPKGKTGDPAEDMRNRQERQEIEGRHADRISAIHADIAHASRAQVKAHEAHTTAQAALGNARAQARHLDNAATIARNTSKTVRDAYDASPRGQFNAAAEHEAKHAAGRALTRAAGAPGRAITALTTMGSTPAAGPKLHTL